jgi:hypothetical protein
MLGSARDRSRSDSHEELIGVKTTGARRTGPVSAVEPFSIDVRRRRDVARPFRG